MEIVNNDQNTPFIRAVDTDAAYPSRVGEPSVDGPVIYPEQQTNDPENVVPFQRETGLDPSKIPSLRDKLRVLDGGKKQAQPQSIVPQSRIANSTNPMTMQRFGAAPEAGASESPFTMKNLAVVAAVAVGAYLLGRASGGGSEPLIADISEDEE